VLSPGIILQQRYRIKRLLARGGMGAVYEAEAVHLRNLIVAVKETFFDEDQKNLREQFEREAATLARLRHPALPQVKDHFVEGGGQFLVMDFIAGDDLGKLLGQRLNKKSEPFEFWQVMEWAERLLDALVYIHRQYPPVIHRDIKPQNLKLTPRGELFLIDFGLAKDATTPTQSGQSVHAYTLGFAPPEQIKGERTDERSDIYSLGATLYNLATGKLPPDARLREEAVVKHLMPDLLEPAHRVNPRVHITFAASLAKAMAVYRDLRYQSAQEMLDAMRRVRQDIEAETAERDRQEAERWRLEEEARRREIEGRRRLEETPAPETTHVTPAVKGKTPRVAPVAIAASLLTALLMYLLWTYSDSTKDKAAGAKTSTSSSSLAEALDIKSMLAPPPPPSATPAEAMSYSLELEKAAGRRVSALKPLPAGERFRLHFAPAASGYLYLIAPGEGGALTVFVAKRRINAYANFRFPDGDNWINVGEGLSFTVIFSPELLNELPFLNDDGRRLTPEEQKALREFGDRFASTSPDTRASNNGAVVTARKRSDEPLIFEIKVTRRPGRG
jgi:serine/threonine protein kinase